MTTRFGDLTERQENFYRYLVQFLLRHQRTPSIREMQTFFEIRSPNGIVCHLKALAQKGYIRLPESQARAIEIVGVKLKLEFDHSDAGRRAEELLKWVRA